ncbi:hypothetical protein HDZ31DRAFT_63126 [Schizophyllum fasciatum]
MPDHPSSQRYEHRTTELSGRVEVLGKTIRSLQADRDKLRLVLSQASAAVAQANSSLATVHAVHEAQEACIAKWQELSMLASALATSLANVAAQEAAAKARTRKAETMLQAAQDTHQVTERNLIAQLAHAAAELGHRQEEVKQLLVELDQALAQLNSQALETDRMQSTSKSILGQTADDRNIMPPNDSQPLQSAIARRKD